MSIISRVRLKETWSEVANAMKATGPMKKAFSLPRKNMAKIIRSRRAEAVEPNFKHIPDLPATRQSKVAITRRTSMNQLSTLRGKKPMYESAPPSAKTASKYLNATKKVAEIKSPTFIARPTGAKPVAMKFKPSKPGSVRRMRMSQIVGRMRLREDGAVGQFNNMTADALKPVTPSSPAKKRKAVDAVNVAQRASHRSLGSMRSVPQDQMSNVQNLGGGDIKQTPASAILPKVVAGRTKKFVKKMKMRMSSIVMRGKLREAIKINLLKAKVHKVSDPFTKPRNLRRDRHPFPMETGHDKDFGIQKRINDINDVWGADGVGYSAGSTPSEKNNRIRRALGISESGGITIPLPKPKLPGIRPWKSKVTMNREFGEKIQKLRTKRNSGMTQNPQDNYYSSNQ